VGISGPKRAYVTGVTAFVITMCPLSVMGNSLLVSTAGGATASVQPAWWIDGSRA
jgi:hypothetical protein